MTRRGAHGPVRAQVPAVLPDEAAWEVAHPAPRRSILVVEDDHCQLQMLGILLEYEHYPAALTENGQEALDWLAGQRPALVLLDWCLPGAGGSLVALAIRERYGAQVPILVVSARADTAKVETAGAGAFLPKPYHIAELVGTIQRLLAA